MPTPTLSPIATPSPIPASTPTPTPTVPRRGLVITEPAQGAQVRFTPVTIWGLAPPDAVITRDISFGFDQHTLAGRTGRWSMRVDLRPGLNVLTFRVGDDRTTEQRLALTLAP